MDFAEFKKMLLECLRDEDAKTEVLKSLSEDSVSDKLKEYEEKIQSLKEEMEKSSAEAEEKYSKLQSQFD